MISFGVRDCSPVMDRVSVSCYGQFRVSLGLGSGLGLPFDHTNLLIQTPTAKVP